MTCPPLEQVSSTNRSDLDPAAPPDHVEPAGKRIDWRPPHGGEAVLKSMERWLTLGIAAPSREYPGSFPNADYYPRLAILQTDISEENPSRVVAEFLDDETVVIAKDAAKTASVVVPSLEELTRVRRRLEAVGWRPELSEDDA